MDQRIKCAIEIMEKDYGNHLRLRRITEEIHLSLSRFEHLFKHELRQTYKSHLEYIRVRKAKDLLMDRSLTIKEVAWKVGYSHPYNLTRAFTKRFGQTPSQYRRTLPLTQASIDVAG